MSVKVEVITTLVASSTRLEYSQSASRCTRTS